MSSIQQRIDDMCSAAVDQREAALGLLVLLNIECQVLDNLIEKHGNAALHAASAEHRENIPELLLVIVQKIAGEDV